MITQGPEDVPEPSLNLPSHAAVAQPTSVWGRSNKTPHFEISDDGRKLTMRDDDQPLVD